MISMIIVSLLFLALLAVGLVYLIRYLGASSAAAAPAAGEPLEIVKKRYAKGEITKEQYEELKKELSEG